MATIKTEIAKLLPPHLHAIVTPLLAGLSIDTIDLATFGPVGLVAGPVVGALAGWWVGGWYGLRQPLRIALTLLTAIYCFAPLTEFIPLATIVSLVLAFSTRELAGTDPAPPEEKPAVDPSTNSTDDN